MARRQTGGARGKAEAAALIRGESGLLTLHPTIRRHQGCADWHLVCDPGERNIRLDAAKLVECGRGDIVLFGHGGGRQHAVGTDEIATLSDGLARKTHRLVRRRGAKPDACCDYRRDSFLDQRNNFRAGRAMIEPL
jgi:hypothetical protein